MEIEKCAFCGVDCPERKRCGNCKAISYCGPGCAKKDWKRHKQECVAMGEERVLRKLPQRMERDEGLKFEFEKFTGNDPKLFYVVNIVTEHVYFVPVLKFFSTIEHTLFSSPDTLNLLKYGCTRWNSISVILFTMPKTYGDRVMQCAKKMKFALTRSDVYPFFCTNSEGAKNYFPLMGPNVWMHIE